MPKENPWSKGYSAAQNGARLEDNPYPKKSDAYMSWRSG